MKTKDEIRREIWRLLKTRKVARFPGAEGRIPNFTGAEAAAKLLSGLPAWRSARVVKVNPDSPQRTVRQKALAEGKILYMAVPRLREAKPFIELDPKRLAVSPYKASSIKGAFQYGRPVGLEEMEKIDLVVCGSVAVDLKGARAGKGGGYSDLEYALLREAKKVGAGTPIVTTVHPLQIVRGGIPMSAHDIPLDAVVTPEKVARLDPGYKKAPRHLLEPAAAGEARGDPRAEGEKGLSPARFERPGHVCFTREKFSSLDFMQKIDFAKGNGLVPVIVQDYRSREVLMMAYMNRAAWNKTKKTGKAHYYSRSRGGLWFKGEESGHYQEVKDVLVDCDHDTLLLRVKQRGGGACHLGYQSCFFRKQAVGSWKVAAKRIFDPAKVYEKPRH